MARIFLPEIYLFLLTLLTIIECYLNFGNCRIEINGSPKNTDSRNNVDN